MSLPAASNALRAALPRAVTPATTAAARTLTTTAARADDAPADPKDKSVDPAAVGVSEMRRQWGGLIDKADREEAARDEEDAHIDMDAHDGLEAEPETTVDPAARGVSEMRRQWGGLIDEKKKD